MPTRPRGRQDTAAHVQDSDADRRAQEEAVLGVATITSPQPLDEERGEGPDPNSTLAADVPQHHVKQEVAQVVDEVVVDYAGPDYQPVLVEESPSTPEYVTVRVNDDYDQFFYGPDLSMSFERGKRYLVHREIANMLQRKNMVV